MKVNEIMRTEVVTCSLGDTTRQAAEVMWRQDVGVLPVVDQYKNVVGMLTARDIVVACYPDNRPMSEVLVQRAMSRSLVTCGIFDDIASVEACMRQHQIHRLPIVEGTRLMGIVTLSDLARASSTFEYSVPSEGIVKTMSEASRPPPE